MKKKITTLLLLFINIILFCALAIVGIMIYNRINDLDLDTYTIDSIATEEPKKEDIKKTNNVIQKISDAIQNSSGNNNQNITVNKIQNSENLFFYNQLSETQQLIYNKLDENKNNLKDKNCIIKYGDIFSDILKNENGSKILGEDYQSAVEAFTHDNPQLFYLDVNKMYLNIETSTRFFKTSYNVYIAPGNGDSYLLDDFISSINVIEAINEVEKVKDNVINHLSDDDYRNILIIHNYLIETIEYDSTYKAPGSYNLYGALAKRKCVCEGYAKAFKYLANSANIDCEIMQGTAINSNGQSESHAWNCVKLNNIWYEVDPTWDDPIVIGNNGKATNEMKYKYFLKGSETFEKDHTLSYNFSENGKRFKYPEISKKDYK